MMIYDKEDLESAKKYLGFNPKFPLKINEDITINQSAVGISDNSDIKNNNISYELDNIYRNKNGSITFNQKKASKEYEDMKKVDIPLYTITKIIKLNKSKFKN